MCCGHKICLPKGRKSDPHTLDMERFRSEVAALMSGAAAAPVPSIPRKDAEDRPTIRRGATGNPIFLVKGPAQARLRRTAGGWRLRPLTEAAMRRFQRAHGLVPTASSVRGPEGARHRGDRPLMSADLVSVVGIDGPPPCGTVPRCPARSLHRRRAGARPALVLRPRRAARPLRAVDHRLYRAHARPLPCGMKAGEPSQAGVLLRLTMESLAECGGYDEADSAAAWTRISSRLTARRCRAPAATPASRSARPGASASGRPALGPGGRQRRHHRGRQSARWRSRCATPSTPPHFCRRRHPQHRC